MQLSMLYNQWSKQYFKLSKTSLNKKNVKHIDQKHTHTHTLNTSKDATIITPFENATMVAKPKTLDNFGLGS